MAACSTHFGYRNKNLDKHFLERENSQTVEKPVAMTEKRLFQQALLICYNSEESHEQNS